MLVNFPWVSGFGFCFMIRSLTLFRDLYVGHLSAKFVIWLKLWNESYCAYSVTLGLRVCSFAWGVCWLGVLQRTRVDKLVRTRFGFLLRVGWVFCFGF